MARALSGNPHLDESAELAAKQRKKKVNASNNIISALSAIAGNPSLDESANLAPKTKGPLAEDKPNVDLGPDYVVPYHDISIKTMPKFNPDNNRNTGYGPKGNIFPSSKKQREEYDRMYGGTGSANAAAMAKMREMGQEGLVARRARERYENSPAGRKPPERPSYTFRQLLGKG
jgi:hypothetical protein